MALTTGTMLALGLAAASAGGNYYNTQQTAKRQDNAAADSIRNQSRIQRRADERVNEEVGELEASTSADERASRMGQYMETLRKGKGQLEAGLTGNIGSDTFRADAARAAGDVQAYAGDNASLMSRMDAPGLQRQGEAFGYGNLGTDLDLIQRQSQGQSFMDDLRMRSIRRNPWIDAASSFAGRAAGVMAGGGGTKAAATKASTGIGTTFFANGGLRGIGY